MCSFIFPPEKHHTPEHFLKPDKLLVSGRIIFKAKVLQEQIIQQVDSLVNFRDSLHSFV